MSKTIQGRAIIQSSPGVKLLLVQGYTWQPIKGHITVQVRGEPFIQCQLNKHLSILSPESNKSNPENHQEHDEVHEELHPQIMNPNFPEH